MNLERICYGCFSEKDPGTSCPHCGFNENEEQPYLALPLGTILNGRYLVGKVLGIGGFGITYLGFDLTLEIKIAIKEYMPSAMATRHHDHYSVVLTGHVEEDYQYGMERFLDEARILAKLQNTPHIVSVQNYFKENGTAYFVMEYIDGVSLKSYLASNGDRISYEQTITILQPIMEALSQVHSMNLLHRDISPDNIYITTKGESRLLDFGAARFALGDGKSVSVILKHGYAPEEQYSSHGNQGPWTDVYAMGATFYRCITGQLPPDSVERIHNDTLKKPSELGISIPSGVEQAIMKALAVKTEERFTNMESFIAALSGRITVQDQVAASISRRTQAAVASQDTTYGATAYQQPYGGMSGVSAAKPNFLFGVISYLKANPVVAWLSGGGLLVVVALCIILPIALSKTGDTKLSNGGGGNVVSPGGDNSVVSMNPDESQTSGENSTPNESQTSGENSTPSESQASSDSSVSSENSAAEPPAKMVEKKLDDINATIKIPEGYEDGGDGTFTNESKLRYVAVSYTFTIDDDEEAPIYSIADLESNKESLVSALTESGVAKLVSSEYTKVGDSSAYNLCFEMSNESDTASMNLMFVEGYGAGCYVIMGGYLKADEAGKAEIDSIIQSFKSNGKPNSGIQLCKAKNAGMKAMVYEKDAKGGVIDNSEYVYGFGDINEMLILPEPLNSNSTATVSNVEAIKGSEMYLSSPTAAIGYFQILLSSSADTYTEHLGGVDWLCFDGTLSGMDCSYASAMIDGECYIVSCIYDDSTEDAVSSLYQSVLSTLRPL